VNTTAISYNVTTPAGRAIQHLLEKSPLADIHADPNGGLEIRDYGDGGRTMIVHPQLSARVSSGEASLLLAVESFAGQSPVKLWWVLQDLDERSKRAFVEAVFIAAGFRGATTVLVP
jgi:hypothetical protein